MDQVQYSQQQLFELGKLNYEKLALHCQTLEVAGLWEQARQVLRQTSTEALDTYVQAMLMKLAIHCGYALDCQMEFIQSIPVGNPLNIQTEMCVDQAWMMELEKIYKFPPILIQLCSLYDQQKGDDITEYFIDALLNILLCMAYLNGGKDDKIDGFIRQYYEKISYYVMGKTPAEHSRYLGTKLASDIIGCYVAKKEPKRQQVAKFQPGTAVAEPEKPVNVHSGREESVSRNAGAPKAKEIKAESTSQNADIPKARQIREESASQRADIPKVREIEKKSAGQRIDNIPRVREIEKESAGQRIDNTPKIREIREESVNQRADVPKTRQIREESADQRTDTPKAGQIREESVSQRTNVPEAEKIEVEKPQKAAAGHVKIRTRGRDQSKNIDKGLAERGKPELPESVEQKKTEIPKLADTKPSEAKTPKEKGIKESHRPGTPEQPKQTRAKAPKPGEQEDRGWIKAEKAENEETPVIPAKTKEEEELEQAELARQEFQRVKQRIQAREQAEVRAHEEKVKELVADLNALVGLNSVKEEIQSLINLIKIRKLRKKMNLPEMDMTYHMVFTGSPGTGKTTVARLVAKIYKELGVLTDGKLVETDRSGLVAGYVGQTAMKVHEIVEQSIGGVLFIDEAYSLVNPDVPNDFGGEAIDTLVKLMEDHRDNLVVIVAGYTKEMQNFLKSNTGLISRFNKFIDFPDYSNDELVSILDMMAKNAGLEIDEGAKAKVYQLLKGKSSEDMAEFGNARGIRNLFEKFVMNQADRLVMLENPTEADLRSITEEDVVV